MTRAIIACLALLVAARVEARACPLSISFAALQATGSKHDYREYVAYLDAPSLEKRAVTFALGVGGETVPVSVDNVAGGAVLFVVPRADVAWIRVCDDSRPFAIRPTNLTREFTFDDSAAWIKKSGVTALAFAAPTLTTILLPDYAARARQRSLEGTARVVAAIAADGTVLDTELLESSGSLDLDNIALAAALRLHFNPGRLPASAGGTSIGSVEDIDLTFTPGMASAHAH